MVHLVHNSLIQPMNVAEIITYRKYMNFSSRINVIRLLYQFQTNV
jgi:hypothetical protein